MSRIHIVTDSYANFVDPRFLIEQPVTVIPNQIQMGADRFREGVDMDNEQALALIRQYQIVPAIIEPTIEDYIHTYRHLIPNHDAIISIHASREISTNWERARTAAQQMMGQCKIVVIDSQMLCTAQAMLVQVAARAVLQQMQTEDIVRQVRGAIERIYAVYFVETLDYLRVNKIMDASHAILGSMLGLKPFITLESGQPVLMEKVKTLSQAVERLVEFAVEFTDIEQGAILHYQTALSEPLHLLSERLMQDFPAQPFPRAVYNPSMAALIGPDATGMVILECEMDAIDDF